MPNPPAAIVCGLPGRDGEENLMVDCGRRENVVETAGAICILTPRMEFKSAVVFQGDRTIS